MRISDWNSDVCSSDLHADPLWLRARQQPEIAATAVGALEVVDALEATVGELPPQGEPSTRLPPGRARVDDDGVEAAARLGQAAVGRGGQQGDCGLAVVRANRLEARHRQHDIPEGRELDDQDAVGRGRHGTYGGENRVGKEWVSTCRSRWSTYQ